MRAAIILGELHKAEAELVGNAVVLTNGNAGTVEHVWLDDLHGLRIANGRFRRSSWRKRTS